MREDPHPQWRELIENIRQQCPIVDFKVKTGLASQSHDFSEEKPYTLDEKRIDKRVYHLSMRITRVFLKHYLILHEEMRDIIL